MKFSSSSSSSFVCRLPFIAPHLPKWAAQFVKHVWPTGLTAPLAHDGTIASHSLVRLSSPCCWHRSWGRQGLHASPRSAPSKGAKLRTYHRCFSCIPMPLAEPYFRFPLSDRCMRRWFRFRLDAPTLPIEMDRRLRMARIAHICPLCPGMHVDLGGGGDHAVEVEQHGVDSAPVEVVRIGAHR